MPPDGSLKRVDFSKQVIVSRNRVANFPQGDVTFSFWIQWRRIPGDFSAAQLIGYCDGMGDMDHPNASPGPRFLVKDPDNITVWFGGTSGSSGVSVGDGQWHHLAIAVEQRAPSVVVHIIRDGMSAGQIELQVDDGEQLGSGGPFNVGFPFYEYQDSDGSSTGKYREGLGSIAEVRIWDGVRSPKQLAVEMTGYLAAHPKLLLYWPLGFVGRLQSAVHDESGQGNDGMLGISLGPGWNRDNLAWPVAPMDLSGVDLSLANVRGIPLHGRNLQGAILGSLASGASLPAQMPAPGNDLRDVDFSSADLSGADIRCSSLDGANLTDATLYGTRFNGSDLTAVTFSPQPKWSRDDRYRTVLDNARIPFTALGKDWSHLHLTGANLVGLGPGSDLSGINAVNIVFERAPMVGCLCQGADFSGADLTAAHLNDADLSGCKLIGTTLYAADLSGATLKGADMTRAKLGGVANNPTQKSAVLSYAFMPGVVLTEAELYGVDLSFAQIYANAKVDAAHLESADLSNANLCDMNFTQAHMKGVDMSGSILVRCNFEGVDLGPSEGGKSSSLSGARLQGADFTAANLNGANLSNAGVALDAGTFSISRIDDNGHLVSVDESFGQTILPLGLGDDNTIWPNRDSGPLSSVAQLVAADPPTPPPCIPSLTSFCPRVKR